MGERGPLQKDERVRARATVQRDKLVKDDVVRGFDLPVGALGYEENADGSPFLDAKGKKVPIPWHPRVVAWWEAFRRSPMAARVTEDVQWESLLGMMLAYQDVWTEGQKGRASRLAEFRSVWASYYITPGDLRRNGLEVEVPKNGEDETEGAPAGPPAPTSLEGRRGSILQLVPDTTKKAPAKKAAPRRRSAAEKAAIARKTTAAKKTPAKRPSKTTG